MSYVDAPVNITGLSKLVNRKKTKKGINIDNIEHDMLRNFKNTKEATDAVDEYKEEMKKITQKSGLDFGETWDPDDLLGGKSKKGNDMPSIDDDDIFGEGFGEKTEFTNKFTSKLKKGVDDDIWGGSKNDDIWGADSDSDSNDESDLFNFDSPSKPKSRPMQRSSHPQDRRHQPERTRYTQDQRRQKTIDTFMDNIADSDMDDDDDIFEQAKESDEIHYFLNQIDSLRDILEEDDVDISHIPVVDTSSSVTEIKNTHKMLRIKNDSRRCAGMAEEGILMIAYAMEDVFDGKRVLFGKFRPNLTGWHTTAQNKLRRMRFETSSVVSNALQTYGVGNWGRIGLELVPSMIIYSKRRQASSVEPDLVDTADFNDAIRDIHDA